MFDTRALVTRNHLTGYPDEVDELEAAYRAGEPVKDLLARFNVDRKTLYNHLNKRGVPKRKLR